MKSCFVNIRLLGLRQTPRPEVASRAHRGRYPLGHDGLSILSIRPNLNIRVATETVSNPCSLAWTLVCFENVSKLSLPDGNWHLGLA